MLRTHWLDSPWNTPRGNPWHDLSCTMAHPVQNSNPRDAYATWHMLRSAYPWAYHGVHNLPMVSTHDAFPSMVSNMVTHGTFQGMAHVRLMIPRKRLHGTKPSTNDWGVSPRPDHGAIFSCHMACVMGHLHGRFSGILSPIGHSMGEPMGCAPCPYGTHYHTY